MDFQPKTIVVQIISYHCPVQKVETFFILDWKYCQTEN